jgi:hypothetical protein
MISRNVAAYHEQEYDAFPRKPLRYGGDLNGRYRIIRLCAWNRVEQQSRRENNK